MLSTCAVNVLRAAKPRRACGHGLRTDLRISVGKAVKRRASVQRVLTWWQRRLPAPKCHLPAVAAAELLLGVTMKRQAGAWRELTWWRI
jgi:hypothetical protein